MIRVWKLYFELSISFMKFIEIKQQFCFKPLCLLVIELEFATFGMIFIFSIVLSPDFSKWKFIENESWKQKVY
jgi:hypothetical protein